VVDDVLGIPSYASHPAELNRANDVSDESAVVTPTPLASTIAREHAAEVVAYLAA
jgi:hypothetical protein